MTTNEQANAPNADQAELGKPQEPKLEPTSAQEKDSPPRRSNVSRAGTRLMATIVLLCAAAGLALFLFSFLGRFSFYAEILGNFRLQIAILMIPAALIVFRIGRWKWLAYSLMLAIAWGFISLGSVYLPSTQPPAGPTKLKIMSFNVFGKNSMRDEVIAEMQRSDPDVIVVLEYNHHWHRRLESLKSEYPHQVLQPRWHGFGLAVFSKHPLSDTKVIQLTRKKTDIPTIIAQVNFGGQKIRICGVHTLSPTNQFRLGLRNRQYNEIAQELLLEPMPTVVMGDFNSVPWSPYLTDFMKKLAYRDSRVGFGHHASWHAKLPKLGIPIDHAFVSADVCVHSRTLGSYAGSDHLPIIFEVSTAP